MKPLLPCAALLLAFSSAHAATYVVTRFDDPVPGKCLAADCSLREAVLAANLTPGADTILLPRGEFLLTRTDATPDTVEPDRGALTVAGDLRIIGEGRNRSRIRWSVLHRYYDGVFRSARPATVNFNLQLEDVAISHGHAMQGGCIHVSDDHATPPRLQLSGVLVEQCSATLGGAIYLYRGTLAMEASELRNNEAGWGGALDLIGDVDVSTRKTVLAGNSASNGGGAVRVYGMGILGPETSVVWVDAGDGLIHGNRTDGRGGGILVADTAQLDLSTTPASAATNMLTITGNQAVERGGGVTLYTGVTLPHYRNRLQRVRIEGNQAAQGGGIDASMHLELLDSEVAGNVASSGDGGGIAFTGSATFLPERRLARVSVRNNSAALGGGGVASECLDVEISDTAFSGNSAAVGRGQALDMLGATRLRHVTLQGNAAGPGLRKRYATSCGTKALRYGNSLLVDGCSTVLASELASDGGNQLGPAAATCPALASLDQLQSQANVFKLVAGLYGGDFLVPGWPSDGQTRPQRNFGLAALCSAHDIRGAARSDGACDAGAFEQ